MMGDGVAEAITTESLSSVIMACMEDENLRFHLDYRKSRAVTFRSFHLILRLVDGIDRSERKISSNLDTSFEYWQI